MSIAPPQVLFLCTGNYYRSRFAEHLFNHHAILHKMPWRAFSRGLAIEMLEKDAGAISPHTLKALKARNINLDTGIRFPIAVTQHDLTKAQHIVALKQDEHQPLMTKKFPDWVDHVEYWQVHDVDCALPEDAIPQIELAVEKLLTRFTL